VTPLEPRLTPLPETEAALVTPEQLPSAKTTEAPGSASSALLPKLRAAAASTPVAAAKVDLDSPEAATPGVNATLSITSNPASNVVVDGRPLGSTPREVSVSPGEHSVVFIHPSKGRKSARVRAVAGKTASLAVEF
jgi:serine/threonine-protein kinase